MADNEKNGSESDERSSTQASNNQDAGTEANRDNVELQELNVPRLQDLVTEALSAQSTSLASSEPASREHQSDDGSVASATANVRTRRAVHQQQLLQTQPEPAAVRPAANDQMPQAPGNVNFLGKWVPQCPSRDSKFGCHVSRCNR